jgi:hypothetical protein
VKHSKPKPIELTSTVVPPPPLPAETAKSTSPVAVAGSKKDTADAAKSSVGGLASVSEGVSVNTVSANDVVNAAAVADREESLEEEGSGDEGSSSKGSESSGEEEEGDEEEDVSELEEDDTNEDDGSDDDGEYLPEEDILVGGEDEEVEDLDNKPPACKSKPVQKSVPEKFAAVAKKNNYEDDHILLSSDIDEAGKKMVGQSSKEAPEATMPKKAVEFFSTPWKHYESVYTLVYDLFL